jgi:hypothetical protein
VFVAQQLMSFEGEGGREADSEVEEGEEGEGEYGYGGE